MVEASFESGARGFVRLSGGALFAGGGLAVAVNGLLTPLLPTDAGSIEVYTGAVFGLRMPLAASVVALTLLGLVGLYLLHADRIGLGAGAFCLAAAGALGAFVAECVQFTLLRDLAFAAPEALVGAEEAGELVRWDIGFAVAAGAFALGWLLVAVVVLRAGVVRRRGPIAVIAGLVLLPLLGGFLGIAGAVVGNLVLGAGWALTGLDLRRAA